VEGPLNWVVGLLFSTLVPTGIGFLVTGYGDSPDDAVQLQAGYWLIAIGVAVLLGKAVMWPAAKLMLGPVSKSIESGRLHADHTLVVNKARYHNEDVTGLLNDRVLDGRYLAFTVHGDDIGIADPAPGTPKKLSLRYSVGGKEHFGVFEDGDSVVLP
jgi:hypothetical protein